MTRKEVDEITLLLKLNAKQYNLLFEYFSVQKLEKEVKVLQKRNRKALNELFESRKQDLISFLKEYCVVKIPNPYRDEETTNPIINPD